MVTTTRYIYDGNQYLAGCNMRNRSRRWVPLNAHTELKPHELYQRVYNASRRGVLTMRISFTIMVVIFILLGSFSMKASASDDKILQQFTVKYKSNSNTNTINDLTFSHEGKMIAVAYGKFVGLLQEPMPGQVIIWNTITGQRVKALRTFQDGVSCVGFSKNSKYLAAGSYDGTVQIWDTTTWDRNVLIDPTSGAVTTLSMCADVNMIAVGTWQDSEGNTKNSIKIYETSNGKHLGTLEGHKEGVTSIHFSADCQSILSTSMDGSVRVWNVKQASGKIIYQGGDPTMLFSASISPDNQLMAVAGGSYVAGKWNIFLWDSKTLKLKSKYSGPGKPIQSIGFSSNSKWFGVGTQAGEGRIWNIETSQTRLLAQRINQIAFSPNGQFIAISHDRTVKILSAEDIFFDQ